jgi:perosamine synthetase
MNFFDTHITQKAISNVSNVLASGHLSEGEIARRFEQALQDKFGMRNVVAVNSGTSALHLALVLAGVGEGDEVILTAQTFVATGLAVLYCGAKPVFADIGMDGNIDTEDMKRKITDRTVAIVSVSWGGNPCDVPQLQRYCGWLPVIQDNAHALGATFENQPLSYYGDYSCHSFQAIKSLSTGDGGALVCKEDEAYKNAKRLRWFGIDRESDLPDETGERVYNLKEIGYKYHMNDYSAALGLGNLSGFEKRQARVKEIAQNYYASLKGSELSLGLPSKKEGCSYWLFDLLVLGRKDFMRAMKSRGVPVSVVHVGIDRNEVFGGLQDLPVQRYWDEHHVCLPIHSSLTDEDVELVIDSVSKGW